MIKVTVTGPFGPSDAPVDLWTGEMESVPRMGDYICLDSAKMPRFRVMDIIWALGENRVFLSAYRPADCVCTRDLDHETKEEFVIG